MVEETTKQYRNNKSVKLEATLAQTKVDQKKNKQSKFSKVRQR
jgi:hypothetical protein